MTLDILLSLLVDGLSAVVIYFLLRKGGFRNFPVFTYYLIYGIITDLVGLAIQKFLPMSYYTYYTVTLAIDSLILFGVLVEVFWSVLRPVRASLPRWSLLVIAAMVAVVGAIIWPLTAGPGLSAFSSAGSLNYHVQETFSILRILFFLALAGFSQLLSIGWRDRELQIATGLGFYSLVSLAVWLQHRTGPQYHWLDQLSSASYLCSLIYWGFSFAQVEATRREFTPQMQNFLLAVAGSARSARGNLQKPESGDDRK